MMSFWRLSTCGWEGWQWIYVLFIAFPVFWTLLMSPKISNTSKKGLHHYFLKKRFTLAKEKFESKTKKLLLNDYVIKNNADFIISITGLMLKFLLKSKDVLYHVSSDLGEVNSFYSSFSDAGQKATPAFLKRPFPQQISMEEYV